MVSAAPAARITQRGTFFKVRCLRTDLHLRIRRNGRVTLTDDRRCTWFTSRFLAIETVSALLGPAVAEQVEVERYDA